MDLKAIIEKHKQWLAGESGGERANLSNANLSDANLSNANLSGANLIGANLSDAVARIDCGLWSICIYHDRTSIGCQMHSNDKWLQWTPEDVAHMDRRAMAWWETHGEGIKGMIRCMQAKHEALVAAKVQGQETA